MCGPQAMPGQLMTITFVPELLSDALVRRCRPLSGRKSGFWPASDTAFSRGLLSTPRGLRA